MLDRPVPSSPSDHNARETNNNMAIKMYSISPGECDHNARETTNNTPKQSNKFHFPLVRYRKVVILIGSYRDFDWLDGSVREIE